MNASVQAVSNEVELPESSTEYATHGAGRKHRAQLPHLRLVAPLRPERASRGFFAGLITVMLAFGLVVMLVVNTSVAQTAFTITELKIQQRDLSRTEAALTKALAEAASPPVLEAQARALGMVPSDRAVFLTVPGGKVRGKAKPAPGSQSRTANIAGSLTATLVDPIPMAVPADAATAAADSGARRQVGDGAVLVDPNSPGQADEATEQARRNQQGQEQRLASTGDGAQLVTADSVAVPDGDGAQMSSEARR